MIAPVARADVYDDNPATASRGGGDAWIFARAADGATLERHWTGSAGGDWAAPRSSATGPAARGATGRRSVASPRPAPRRLVTGTRCTCSCAVATPRST